MKSEKSSSKPKISVCIPTYKRTSLLKQLIQDLLLQSIQPDHIILVDGDPTSGSVMEMLNTLDSSVPITYVPSNHRNLAYQRYLGWKAVGKLNAEVLIYFDDDQRIYQSDVLEWLSKPLLEKSDVVGVGCYSRVPKTGYSPSMDHLVNKHRQDSVLVNKFGSHKALNLKPGQLTPTGHRVGLQNNNQDYIDTAWLQGRIMAYCMSAITQETFSKDLFALYEKRIGRAEDTFLSRRIGASGKMLYTFRAIVDHPNADVPIAYETDVYKFTYAATYSRRFLNDYYRVYDPPTLSDRWALLKSYVGNTFLAWMRVVTQPSKLNFARAKGTTLGAVHGLTRPPTAERLTPDIDWWQDAEDSLENTMRVK